MQLAAILLLFILLAIKLKSDLNKWQLHRYIKHSKIAYFIPTFFFDAWLFAKGSNLNLFPAMLLAALAMALFWWVAFDLLYNVLRKQKAFSTGSEDGRNDARTDNFLQRLLPWQIISIKIFCLATSLFIYFNYL